MALAVNRYLPLIVGTLLSCGLAWAAPLNESDEEKARRVWDEAIAAKGGRVKLHEVVNLVISSRSPWGIRGINRFFVSYESLIVLPARIWEWVDERPTVFGLRAWIIDLERDFFQMIYGEHGRPGPDGKQRKSDGKPNPPATASIGDRRRIRELQLVTLMETRWLRPKLKRARNDWWRFRRVTVVETEVEESSYDFYLDRKSHLPVRLVVTIPTDAGIATREYHLGQYREVSGLQLPHRVVDDWWPGKVAPQVLENEYQINVEYDEEIFQKPPSLERGPKGWMKVR